MKRLLALALVCSCSSDPAQPPKPRYERGPGCTVVTKHQLRDSIFDLTVHRFEHCVSVEWDSTLVR